MGKFFGQKKSYFDHKTFSIFSGKKGKKYQTFFGISLSIVPRWSDEGCADSIFYHRIWKILYNGAI